MLVTHSPRRPTRAIALLSLRRLAGFGLFAGLLVGLTLLAHHQPTHDLVRWTTDYSPARLVQGRVWTLPASALVLAHLKTVVGPSTLMLLALLLPYVLARGTGRAATVFMSGHVLATLSVAGAVLVGLAFGLPGAVGVAHRVDVGASAGLAATGGALAVVVARRSSAIGLAVLTALFLFFLNGLLFLGGNGHGLTDVEHLVAVTVGATLELSLPGRATDPELSRARAAQPSARHEGLRWAPCQGGTEHA